MDGWMDGWMAGWLAEWLTRIRKKSRVIARNCQTRPPKNKKTNKIGTTIISGSCVCNGESRWMDKGDCRRRSLLTPVSTCIVLSYSTSPIQSLCCPLERCCCSSSSSLSNVCNAPLLCLAGTKVSGFDHHVVTTSVWRDSGIARVFFFLILSLSLSLSRARAICIHARQSAFACPFTLRMMASLLSPSYIACSA